MPALQHRLDRYISKLTGIPKGQIRLLLAQNKITVDDEPAYSIHQAVNQFSKITLDGAPLTQQKPIYIAYHKPAGILSATKDNQHTTVIDALREIDELRLSEVELTNLHIVGRLDKNSSGLTLLTNDSRWSRRIMSPEHKVVKCYRVKVEKKITEECQEAFIKGIYFEYEDSVAKALKLTKVSELEADIELTEGKYHQIKRMFGRFRNAVLAIHRTKIGSISLEGLEQGQARHLKLHEIELALSS